MTIAERDNIVARLGDADPQVRLAAVEQIIEHPPAEISEDLIAAMLDNLTSDRKAVQRKTATALAALAGNRAELIQRIEHLLTSSDQRTRWGAAFTLGLIADALDLNCLPVLLESLGNDDGDLRWAAANLIVRLGQSSTAEVRVALLAVENDANFNAQKMVLYCLRDLKMNDPDTLQLARRQCRSSDIYVRLAALSLLSILGDADRESAEAALRCLTHDADMGVRRSAASALGRLNFRAEAIIEGLRRASSEADPSLKKAALQSLKSLGYENGGRN